MNLIQPLLNSLGPQTWGTLAGTLNETPERTRQGLSDALPMLFATLIGKGSTLAGAAGLLSIMRNSHIDLDRVAGSAVTEPSVLREGGALAQTVLGDSYSTAARTISRHTGVGLDAAQSLLGLAAPLALSGIVKAAPASGFTPEGLMRFLQGQRDDVLAAAPQGLAVDIRRAPANIRAAAAAAAAPPAARRASGIWPWLFGIGAALLLALAVGQCMNARAPAPPVAVAPPALPAAPATQAPTLPTMTLPGGVTLNAPIGSIGYNLATYLGGAEPAPHTFTFDNITFDSGDVTLTPESSATLDAVATTLNAYPNAQVRLEGYTDAIGDRAANVSLSLARANSVKRQLSERGIDPARVDTAGLGPDRPIASNDTEEGRAANRRLDLTVTRK